jgi:transcriptional regulator with XRE-family HTH domain
MIENPTAKRIQALLDAQNITVADVARETGLSYHTINNLWRRPAAKLSAENAEKVAGALGTTARYILFGDAPATADRLAGILALYDEFDEALRKELEDYALFLASRKARTGP